MRRQATAHIADAFRVTAFSEYGRVDLAIVCLTCKRGLRAFNLLELDRLSLSHGPGICDAAADDIDLR